MEDQEKKREQSKLYERKKILKARVHQLVYKVFYQSQCKLHHRRHHDYQAKLAFHNQSRLARDNENERKQKSPLKKQFNDDDDIQEEKQISRERSLSLTQKEPKIQEHIINHILLEKYTEQELQEMFEDIRFFFPEDQVYQHVEIFRILDIFNGDHFNIKESYKRYKINEKLREKQELGNHQQKEDQMNLIQNESQVNDESQADQKQNKKVNLFPQKNSSKVITPNSDLEQIKINNQAKFQPEIANQYIDQELSLIEQDESIDFNPPEIQQQQPLINSESLQRLPKLSLEQYKNFQQFRAQSQSHRSLSIFKKSINVQKIDSKYLSKLNIGSKTSRVIEQENSNNSYSQNQSNQQNPKQRYISHSQNNQDYKAYKDSINQQTQEHSELKEEADMKFYEKQLRYQQKLKQVEMNKIRNVYEQVATTLQNNQLLRDKQHQLAFQRRNEAENQKKIVSKFLPNIDHNLKQQRKSQNLQTQNKTVIDRIGNDEISDRSTSKKGYFNQNLNNMKQKQL
eukprot:403360046